MIVCDKIISVSVTDIVSTKMTNTTATNVTKIVIVKISAIFARDCYILHRFISDRVTINIHYYLISLCKSEKY